MLRFYLPESAACSEYELFNRLHHPGIHEAFVERQEYDPKFDAFEKITGIEPQ